ncbi:MAG: hypothetical protein E7470_07855 [Ruminococcaceae bacterium]|nr:hypothetical protein [Oscillospiraceae bacterium]
MQQKVRVLRWLDENTAEVVRIRESACSGDCHKCAGCGAARETIVFQAENPIHAKEGELVIISSESASVLKAAAILYLVPVVLFIGFFLLGETAWKQGTLMGGVGFVLGIAGAVLYDRLVLRKQKTVYTITGYPDTQGAYTKGEEELD